MDNDRSKVMQLHDPKIIKMKHMRMEMKRICDKLKIDGDGKVKQNSPNNSTITTGSINSYNPYSKYQTYEGAQFLYAATAFASVSITSILF